MKILYITGHGRAGSNVSLLHAISGLLSKKINIEVVVPDKETELFFKKLELTTIVIPISADYWPFLNTTKDYFFFLPRILLHFTKNFFAYYRLRQEVKSYKPDIIHTNISTIQLGYKISYSQHIPHLWHVREYNTKDFGYIPIPSESSLHKKIRNSYTISISNCIQQYYNLQGQGHRVIYNGILKKNSIIQSQAKEDYFLYVGGLSKGKGFDFLIKAFVRFVHIYPDTKLLIAGGGVSSFISEINQIIYSNHIENNVVFLGNRDDVYDLMRRARALIVSSLSEAFGRITAEAMMNRCLVIGHNCAGTKEQLDKGDEIIGREIGLRYNDENELIKCMQTVVEDYSQFSKMVDDAYYVSNMLYTEEKNAEEIYNFYQQIIND